MPYPYILCIFSQKSFFAAFRIVAWKFLYFWKSEDERLDPQYYSCPAICGETDEARNDLCSECPHRERKDHFRKETIFALDKYCGNGWRKYGFDNLFAAVLDVTEIDRERDELTVTAARLADIIESERAKMRRIEDWNNRQQRKN